MKVVQFSRPPPALSIYVQNFSTSLTLDVQFQTKPSPQTVTNQLKENIIQGWLLYVIRYFLQVGFRFSYQRINLVWLFFDFSLFSWSLTICFSVASCTCVGSCPKMLPNVFYLYLFTFLVPILQSTFSHFNIFSIHLQSTCFICLIWKSKPSTSHSNWPRVLLFDLVHKQCNGTIKGLLHCQKEDFLSIYINVWISAMAGLVLFSLIKKIKIGRPEHSLTPHPPTSDTFHFCLPSTPYPTPQSGRQVCYH